MYWRKLNPNALTSYLGTQGKKLPCCKDKKLGCCLLRRIVISHLYRNERTNK